MEKTTNNVMENNELKNILIKIGETNPKYTLEKQVYNNGKLIEFIDKPSEKIQLAAVKEKPSTIRFIENPSERVQLAAVKLWGASIIDIKNPTEKVQLAAIKHHSWIIKHIKNPTEKAKQFAKFMKQLKGY
jgi:hypothetical protein